MLYCYFLSTSEYGGIYLDTDYIPVRSFTPLRKYNLTLGHENENQLCNGVIIGQAGSKFIDLWYNSYQTFNDNEWAVHSTIKPYVLSQIYPKYIHIETASLHRPNYAERDQIYKTVIDFKEKYGIHLWFRFYNKTHNTEDVKGLRSTYGSLCRLTLYNTTTIMEE